MPPNVRKRWPMPFQDRLISNSKRKLRLLGKQQLNSINSK
jgi:hypothetical protein